jgi:hypothetical protein
MKLLRNHEWNNKVKSPAFLLYISILLFVTPGIANIRNITVKGGNIVPTSSSPSARMVNEHVTITMYRDSCRIHCEFTILDTLPRPTFLIGFPLIRSEFMDYRVDSSNAITYSYHDTTFTNFKCSVDDKESPSELMVDTNSSYGPFKATVWRLLKTNLKANIPRKVTIDYSGKWYFTCFYYIGTGALWSRAIESGRIVFDHSHVASTNFVARTKEEDSRCVATVSQNSGISIERYRDSLVYVLTKYRPKADEMVSIRMFRFWGESIAPEYWDTLKLRAGPFYGKITDFRYRFLWDTLTYVHKSNLISIRDELLKKYGLTCESGSNDTNQCRTTDCFIFGGTKNYQDSVSYAEKSMVNILTGRIDELKEEHDTEQKLCQKITISKCKVIPLDDSSRIYTNDFIDSLKARVKYAEKNIFESLLPIFKYGCQGGVSIQFTVDDYGTIQSLKIRSTTDGQFARIFCNEGIGMHGCQFSFMSTKGSFKCNLELTIRIYQVKTPKPFNNFEPPPCKN